MKTIARLRSWIKAMTHRSRLDAEMQTELEFHIESYAEDLMRGGVSRDEALRRARLELGSVTARKEDCRESLGLRLWDDLRADIVYGLRMLKKSPGFASIAVASLALGIGANTIIFTLAKEALLDELAVPHPEQLRLLTWDASRKDQRNLVVHDIWGDFHPGPSGTMQTSSFSWPVYKMLRQQNRSLDDLFAFKNLGGYNQLNATIDGHAQTLTESSSQETSTANSESPRRWGARSSPRTIASAALAPWRSSAMDCGRGPLAGHRSSARRSY